MAEESRPTSPGDPPGENLTHTGMEGTNAFSDETTIGNFFVLDNKIKTKNQSDFVECLAKLAKDPTRPVVSFKAALKMFIQKKELLPTQIMDNLQRNLLMLLIMARNIPAMHAIFWLGLWRHYYDYKIPETSYGTHAGKTVLEYARSVVRSNKVSHELKILGEQEESLNELLRAARDGNLKEVQRLIGASRNQELKMLLQKRDKQGNTVLHHACASGKVEVVRLFIRHGCNMKAANHLENNLLHLTILHGSPAVLKELLKHKAVNVEEKNRADRTPAMLCAEMGSIRMLQILMKAGAIPCDDLLGIAASKGCLPFVKFCIEKLELNLNHVDSKKCTVLHHAISQSNVKMMNYILENLPDKRALLLARDQVGRTVLHACCDNVLTDSTALTQLLDVADEVGVLNELMNCQDLFTGNNTCVLVSGRDKGRPAFHYVLSHRHMVSLFEKRVGGGVVDVSQFGTVVKSGWGDYPPEDVIKEVDDNLIKRANLDRNPQSDVTALHLSVYKEKTEHVKALIDYGANVNHRDCFGMAPLHLAAMRGNLPLVQMLVKAGGDLTMKNFKGEGPVDIARLNEHEKVLNYFKGNDYMELSKIFREKFMQRLATIDSKKMQKKREEKVDTDRITIDALRGIQDDINKFLYDLGSSPIMEETEIPSSPQPENSA